MATPIESFTAVLLQLNMHYKTRVALKLTGISEEVAPTAAAATQDGSGAAPAAEAPAPAKAAAGRKGNGSSGAAAAAEPTA
jgi:hypothetical protein